MSVVLQVLRELWYFVVYERFGLCPPVVPYESLPDTLRIRKALPPGKTDELSGDIFTALPQTPLWQFPTKTIDGVLRELPYGSRLDFRKRQHRWLEVASAGTIGWVEADVVLIGKETAWPELTPGEEYHATHKDTLTLRAAIADEFHLAANDLPLQAIEYVTYRLLQVGKQIAWPPVRPRIAGTWQRHLKGMPQIHIGIYPKVGSVLEYVTAEDVGVVAYVEEVGADDSMTMATVANESGVFKRGLYQASVWREWRPVFIELL